MAWQAAAAGAAGSGIGSIFSKFAEKGLDALFGGGKGRGNEIPKGAHIDFQQKELAGSQGEPTSAPSFQRLAGQAGEALGAVGNKVAGQVFDRLVDSQVDRLFQPKDDPIKRGMNELAYRAAASGGRLNPLEMSGGTMGASSAGGGTAVTHQQEQASQRLASKTTRSQRDVAGISVAPQIKKVETVTPSEVKRNEAIAREKNVDADIKEISSAWKPVMQELEFSQRSLENARTSAEKDQILSNVNLIRKKVATEVQKTGKTKADKEVQNAYAQILKPVANSEALANFLLAIGTLSTAGIGVGGLGRIIPKLNKIKPLPKKSLYGPNQFKGTKFQGKGATSTPSHKYMNSSEANKRAMERFRKKYGKRR